MTRATLIPGKRHSFCGPGPEHAKSGDGRGSDVGSNSQDLPKKRATYLTLMGLFAGLFAAMSGQGGRKGRKLDLRPMDLVLLGLSTYRAGRVIAFDQVTEPLRAPLVESSGEGTKPKGSGVRAALGELVSCSTCIGTWIAAGLVYGLRVAPTPTRAFLAFMSASGIAEVLDYAVQALDRSAKADQAKAKEAEARTAQIGQA